MAVYYNEWEKYPAQWLRNLIVAELIPEGDVDERDIRTIAADDLRGYAQCHFFAGIGGWPLALRLAGWDDARPVWTGSCPCQCFSSAGKKAAQLDERHLWPDWYRLIRECRPDVVFGEQVDEAIAYGWLDDVLADMEKEAYSCAAVVLPACSVAAPHKRSRLFFVSHAGGEGKRGETGNISEKNERQDGELSQQFVSATKDAANTDKIRCKGRISQEIQGQPRLSWGIEREFENFNNGWPISASKLCSMDDGIFRRTSKLSAYGNAIVPALGAEFIRAYMECRP